MRTRLQTLLPPVLALTLVSLLAVPAATLAQSDGPTLAISPEAARPGSTVELTGTRFPSEHLVEVELITPDGTTHLATTASTPEGDFREIVALPSSATVGDWVLRATAVDGTSTTFGFSTVPAVVPEEAEPVAAAEPAALEPAPATTARGNTSGDIALMLIIAVVLGGVAFGGMVVYRQLKDESPPGMGKGDDLIWGGGAPQGPEQTATEEPYWKSGQPSQGTQAAHTES